mgnify:CR=1 FL=1
MFRGETQKAMQSLMSNGCAEATPETAKIMRDMHPEGSEELFTHPPPDDEVRVTTKQAKKFLFHAAVKDKAAPGVFGWSAQLLIAIRGQKKKGRLPSSPS